VAAVTWAVYSVVLRRFVRGMSLLQISTSTIVVCAVLMVIGTALISPSELRVPPASAWLSLLFMGVIGSGLAYLWWNLAVLKIGAARAVSFLNLVAVFTAAIGVALGETISLAELLGAALVVSGVALATANGNAGQKEQAA
jgi:drug/metabolite transporter (DMT)-like permease